MKTLIVGASPNPARYAYLAAERLQNNNFESFLLELEMVNCLAVLF